MKCGAVYTYTIGSICSVLNSRDPATQDFQQRMDLLNGYMEEISLPKSMRFQLREYFSYCRQLFRNRYYQDVLQQMTPKLRGQVAKLHHGQWIAKIPFFCAENDLERGEFITHIALHLEPEAFCPDEMIYFEGAPSECLYIVQKGYVFVCLTLFELSSLTFPFLVQHLAHVAHTKIQMKVMRFARESYAKWKIFWRRHGAKSRVPGCTARPRSSHTHLCRSVPSS